MGESPADLPLGAAAFGANPLLCLGFRPCGVWSTGECLINIGEQVIGYAPPRAVVALDHERGIVGQNLDAHPDLAQRQQSATVLVAPPPVGVAEPVKAAQVGFYGVCLLVQQP
ncbi:hypothetical protein [Nocardia brasiliensis]|uniref:hypothetical protein n=1 Tax=Nocardia brasiliensis TaxID=37326 RepID=UPI002456AFFC|nr:hypothetical protein [Nocardia brasiliensis]